MSGVGAVLAAVLPSLGVGLIFWFVIRAIIGADRRERQAMARLDAEQDAADRARAAGSGADSDGQA